MGAPRETRQLIEELLAKQPSLTVREMGRAFENAGTPIAWDEIQRVRLQWLQKRELNKDVTNEPGYAFKEIDSSGREQDRVFVPISKVGIIAPRCANCGGGHWISQCLQPPKKPEPSPLPLIIEAAEPQPVVPEVPMHAVEAPAAIRPTQDPRKKRVADVIARRQYLNELLDAEPGAEPVRLMALVKERFSTGVSWGYLYDTCRVAREVHGLPQIATRSDPDGRASGTREPLPTFQGVPVEEEEVALALDEEMLWLAKQAGDSMRAHGLAELRLSIENGRATWEYKVVKTGKGEVTL